MILSILLYFIYFILALFVFLFYKIYLKPKHTLSLVKKKYKDLVDIYYFPIVGSLSYIGRKDLKDPMGTILGSYLNEPNNKIKFRASNFIDKVTYWINDADMIKEFLVTKV